ncbi:formate/nitrite transporter family protein [Bifidobacterium vespertilionis]|uniref:Formate/nitrite transporter family protein n=1 Tax=Bifidobacterium vespertilionis TaxID=2562524 RepID=A0A5J5E052_9BIFI|nr:formate/nitrite transporter family protein [Bifidobacterium vespertilionis]KAA8822501.1 formate/nitrite transporter family protein [Bifidobacterium vespertilionis]KAA8824437.1 formate/nitrite transporter family protein [Bifidobacterium vespertilionis]
MSQPQPSVNALTPAQVEEAVDSAAEKKVATPFLRLLVSAMFAGAFIGFGALFFTVVTSDSSLSFAAAKLLGGLAFCLGLVLVLCCGSELFTGNSLMVSGAMEHRIGWGAMLGNWAVVWIGNLLGALLAVALVSAAHILDLNAGAAGTTAIAVAAAKISPSWLTLFFRGILCNIFVCLAVRIGFAARSVADKVLGILLPISAFVACGFEHCVANMFFLPMGLVAKLTGYALPSGADASVVSVTGILYNISAATLGNIVGGAIFVGLAYWFVQGHHADRGIFGKGGAN